MLTQMSTTDTYQTYEKILRAVQGRKLTVQMTYNVYHPIQLSKT